MGLKKSLLVLISLFIFTSNCYAHTKEEVIKILKVENFSCDPQGIAELTKDIKTYPDIIGLYFIRGECYRMQRSYAQAMTDYNKYIELNPNGDNVYSIAKFVKKDLNNALFYGARSEAAIYYGNFAQAIADLTKLIEMYPDQSEVFYRQRGFAYYSEGEYDKAWADVHKARVTVCPSPIEGTNINCYLSALIEASGRKD